MIKCLFILIVGPWAPHSRFLYTIIVSVRAWKTKKIERFTTFTIATLGCNFHSDYYAFFLPPIHDIFIWYHKHKRIYNFVCKKKNLFFSYKKYTNLTINFYWIEGLSNVAWERKLRLHEQSGLGPS